MKSHICIAFSVVILLTVIGICNGSETNTVEVSKNSCYTDCKDALPIKLQKWKDISYGLEIPSGKFTDKKLVGYDASTQEDVNKIGQKTMKKQVDRMIETNQNAGLPDFTIIKLDPISYKHKKQDMFITFSNVKMYHLDSYAFDEKAAKYVQTGMYEKGFQEIKPAVYEQMIKDLKQKNNKLLKELIKRITVEEVDKTAVEEVDKTAVEKDDKIDAEKDDKIAVKEGDKINVEEDPSNVKKYTLNRRDCKWEILITANFVANQNNRDTPIVIETDFKIQPDKTKNLQNSGIIEDLEIGEEPLRAKGSVRIEFRDFDFKINLDVTHIDDALRPYLDEDIKSENLAPDFNVDYKVKSIKFKNIEIKDYDGDDNISEPPDNFEDVNFKVLTEEEWKTKIEEEQKQEFQRMKKEKDLEAKQKKDRRKKGGKSEEPKPTPEVLRKKEDLKKQVLQHLNTLSDLVKDHADEIKKRLCRNLLPKMAWKIMHMDSKRQLPTLFYQIIAYEDSFYEKVKLPPFTLSEWFTLGTDYIGAKIGSTATAFKSAVTSGFTSMFSRRSKSSPAEMQRMEKNNK